MNEKQEIKTIDNLKRKQENSNFENTNEQAKKYKADSSLINPESNFLERKRKLDQEREQINYTKRLKKNYLDNRNVKLQNYESIASVTSNITKKSKFKLAETDQYGNTFLFHPEYAETDIFFNNEKKCNYETFKKQDLFYYIIDEVSLEGLDGITLEAFFKRFNDVFPNYINKNMKEIFWRTLCNAKNIDFYILEQPRSKLIFHEQYKYMDYDSGAFMEPFVLTEDIYPCSVINNLNIMGSCSTFYSRTKNNELTNLSYADSQKLYDQKLVCVANQKLRNKSIINEEFDPLIENTAMEYCVLERIGRSRYHGELTSGNMSLQSFCNNGRSLSYIKKTLTKVFLIACQYFFFKALNSALSKSGCLLHLNRFYNKRQTRYMYLAEQVANLLRQQDNYQMEYAKLRDIFGKNYSISKMLLQSDYHNFFKSVVLNYRDLHPNATARQFISRHTNKEREVRALQLVDPHVNISACLESPNSQKYPEITITPKNLQNCSPFTSEIYAYILSKGDEGITTQEISDNLQCDFYSTRIAIQKLSAQKLIDSQRIDIGRQQSFKFFTKCSNRPDFNVKNEIANNFQLPKSILSKILKDYPENFIKSNIEYSTSLKLIESNEISTNFTSSFTSLNIFKINAFQSIELLLLKESNIMDNSIENLDELLQKYIIYYQKQPKKMSLIQQFFSSKHMKQALSNMQLNLEPDNIIISSTDKRVKTKKSNLAKPQINFGVKKNYINPHSNLRQEDLITKIALFRVILQNGDCVHTELNELVRKDNTDQNNLVDESNEALVDVAQIELNFEKFMGSNPILVLRDETNDIKEQVFVSNHLTNFINNPIKYYKKQVDNFLSKRTLYRLNTTLRIMNEQKVIFFYELLKIVRKDETNRAYEHMLCKKSLDKILVTLAEEGYIKVFKLFLLGKNLNRTRIFVCHPSIAIDNPVLKSECEQFKLKVLVYPSIKTERKVQPIKKIASPFVSNDVKNSIVESKKIHTGLASAQTKYKYDRYVARKLGYRPKFLRMRILHEFLFYLIFDLPDDAQAMSNQEVYDICDRFQIKMRKIDVTSLPPVYNKEISWKTFIKPLPIHKGWPQGWVLICDILLRLPLSVFVKIHQTTHIIPGINEYVNHPIKRHYLMKQLPPDLRNGLFYRKKYFTSIYETICNLCYIGVMQIGPKKLRDKEQVFVYFNKNASLLDTTISEPNYNRVEVKKYKKISYIFNSSQEIENYWDKLWEISMNTPLGKRNVMDGKSVIIENAPTKPAMIKALKVKSVITAVENDKGKIPGDHRGAAGLDSSLWSFLKRNWLWNVKYKKRTATSSLQPHVFGLRKEKLDIVLPQPIPYEELMKANLPIDQNAYKTANTKKPASTKIIKKKPFNTARTKKNKIIIRLMVAPKKIRQRKYHDNIDQILMSKNKRTKVEWDENEDRLLRLSRAVSLFLCQNNKKLSISYTVIRDVCHRIYPKSQNKTATACQRRLYNLLLNDEKMQIIETNIESLLNSCVISKYFSQLYYQSGSEETGRKLSFDEIHIAYIYLMSHIAKYAREIELMLLGYVSTLDYFSDSYIDLFESILDYSDETNANIRNPTNNVEIKKNVIKSIVHSSLSNKSSDDASFQQKLFHIYLNFPDELIRLVIADLKKNHFLLSNRSIISKDDPISSGSSPQLSQYYKQMTSQITYSASIFVEAYKQFCLMLNGKNELTTNGSNFLSHNVLNSFWSKNDLIFDIPDMVIILNPNLNDHNEVIDELSLRFHTLLEKVYEREREYKEQDIVEQDNTIVDKNEDSTLTKTNEMIEEVKNFVMGLIFRVPYYVEGALEEHFKDLMDCSDSLEIDKHIYAIITELSTKIDDDKIVEGISLDSPRNKLKLTLSNIVHNIQNKLKDNSDDTDSMVDEEFTIESNDESNPPKIDKLKSTKTKETIPFIPGIINDGKAFNNGMNNCIKRAMIGDIPTIDEIKEGMIVDFESSNERTIPHITDLNVLLAKELFPELDTDDENIERLKEHFVMQYPTLKEFVVEDLEELKSNYFIKYLRDHARYQIIREKIANCNVIKLPDRVEISKYLKNTRFSPDKLQALTDFIQNRKEMGVSSREIKDNFPAINTTDYSDLIEMLKFLIDFRIVLRTGVSSFIFVHYKYQSVWLLKSTSCNQNENKCSIDENVDTSLQEKEQISNTFYVNVKPWITVDGTLHEYEFEKWLSHIFSYCLDFPNVTFTNLCKRFRFINPVDLYCILENLQEFGCIEICSQNNASCDLFSKRNCYESKSITTFLDDFEDTFVSVHNMSALFMGSYWKSKNDCNFE